MRTRLTIILLFASLAFLQAQNPKKISIKSGNYDREYLLYIPKSYVPQKSAGLIVCLHGFNRTMEDFFSNYSIAPIADSLNLVVLAPQALPEQDPEVVAKSAVLASLGIDIPLDAVWSCGIHVKATASDFISLLDVTLNVPVDDVSFINQIINSTMNDYTIDPANKFLFGTSMGGFMSYQYAMLKGNDLAGMVSVCGSMGTSIQVPTTLEIICTPICDFHSEEDEVVPYEGSYDYPLPLLSGFTNVKVSLCQPKPDVIDFWSKKDHTYQNPTIEDVNYYPSTNDKTVKKYTYSNSDGKNEVIHYQIRNASHNYYFSKYNGDCMDYNEEIIKFLTAHMSKDNTGIQPFFADNFAIYPNPVKDLCKINGTHNMLNGISIYTISGNLIATYNSQEDETVIDFSGYAKGVYLLKYGKRYMKIIKE